MRPSFHCTPPRARPSLSCLRSLVPHSLREQLTTCTSLRPRSLTAFAPVLGLRCISEGSCPTALRLELVPHSRWPPFTRASFTPRTAATRVAPSLPSRRSPLSVAFQRVRAPLHSASSSSLTLVGLRSLVPHSLRGQPSTRTLSRPRSPHGVRPCPRPAVQRVPASPFLPRAPPRARPHSNVSWPPLRSHVPHSSVLKGFGNFHKTKTSKSYRF